MRRRSRPPGTSGWKARWPCRRSGRRPRARPNRPGGRAARCHPGIRESPMREAERRRRSIPPWNQDRPRSRRPLWGDRNTLGQRIERRDGSADEHTPWLGSSETARHDRDGGPSFRPGGAHEARRLVSSSRASARSRARPIRRASARARSSCRAGSFAAASGAVL